jgi:hypothetical protein
MRTSFGTARRSNIAPFDVNTICWRVVHDPVFYQQMQSAPADALHGTGVSDAEREALLAGDVARLYELGASPFLLEHLANWRVLGLDHETYSDRIRAVAWRAPA